MCWKNLLARWLHDNAAIFTLQKHPSIDDAAPLHLVRWRFFQAIIADAIVSKAIKKRDKTNPGFSPLAHFGPAESVPSGTERKAIQVVEVLSAAKELPIVHTSSGSLRPDGAVLKRNRAVKPFPFLGNLRCATGIGLVATVKILCLFTYPTTSLPGV